MIRSLLLSIFLTSACSSEDRVSKRSTPTEFQQALQDAELRYSNLVGILSQINNLIYSDFSSCAGVNASDTFISKVCKIAQASTVESRADLKSQLQTATVDLQVRLSYVNKDLQSIYTQLDSITTIQTQISSIESTLTTLNNRLTTLEGEVTDITEGKCSRTRTSSVALTGSVATYLWDLSIRMNSSYCTYNVPTAEYTIQKAGWYEVKYKVNLQHTNGNTILTYRTWIYLNNTTQIDISRLLGWTNSSNSQGEYITLQTSFLYQFVVGDIIEVQGDAASGNSAFGAGGANYNLLGNESLFTVEYVDDP
jgi:hypothetical protein